MTAIVPAHEGPSMPVEDRPYGKCQDCDIDLADRDAVTAHGRETMAPTNESGIIARGHRVRIINPTEAEQRASTVRMRLGDALDDACESLYERVERGEFTAAEVSEHLWMFDLRDQWDDYVAEAEA
jgi:hypothetical protein